MTATTTIVPVILSGGAGTRLWPLSRQQRPKQLLALAGDRTMLQETVLRTASQPGFAAPLVVCNDDHRFQIGEQLGEIGVAPAAIMVEPVARNTAPALAAAAAWVAARQPDALLLAQPSDHIIGDAAAFRAAVARAAPHAAAGRLVTFGIPPTRAETGFGYIQRGAPLGNDVFAVARFIEKPARAAAEALIAGGDVAWNSGLFLFPAALLLAELERLQPELLRACRRAVEAGRDDLELFRLDPAAFAAAPAISIDYAVMERTERAAVAPVEMAWSDIGAWPALRDALERDANGNVLLGEVIAHDVTNSYVNANGHLVAAIGLKDVVVVATEDAILVTAADRAQEVGRVVEQLRRSNRQEALHHRRVLRPWGSYETVDRGDRFQVKRIVVKPGQQLSLQKHHHRAEHWVVVAGTAKVTVDGRETLLRENESVYIPLGATHRLENPGRLPLHLIEVQSGAYLGEDDIVRFDDRYGRA